VFAAKNRERDNSCRLIKGDTRPFLSRIGCVDDLLLTAGNTARRAL